MKKRQAKSKATYTKKWVTAILIFGMIGGMLPYVLAAFGLEGYEALGEKWIGCTLGVALGYFMKSFFETRQERKQRLEDYKAGLNPEESEDEGNG